VRSAPLTPGAPAITSRASAVLLWWVLGENVAMRGIAGAIAVALSVILLMQAGETFADDGFEDGNSLKAKCDDKVGGLNGVCLGYVIGIADVMSAAPVLGRRACVPRGVTKGQVADVVSK